MRIVDEFGIKSLVHGFGPMNLWSLVVYKMQIVGSKFKN